MIFDRFRKKNDMSLPSPIETGELPEDLERFRMKPPDIKPLDIKTPEIRPLETKTEYPEIPSYGKTVEELVSERNQGDKIELILQKLETIDARLRLLEEKLKRY